MRSISWGARLLLLACLAPALLQAAVTLTRAEQRGKQIYLEGTSPSGGEITAVMGEGVEVPASAVPCAGCHGRDGRGRPEGGVSPSDLTWSSLTRPYGVTHPSGRRHPAYDERLLKRAISLGLDPAGNTLHVAMPRFRMSLQDMTDLVAYVKKLGQEGEAGVSAAEVRIGVVLPPPGPQTPLGQAVRAVLTARFDQVNEDGGLYGRRLAPHFLEPPADPAARRTAVADFLDREEIFAGVAAFFSGADRELAALFAEKQVPLVGPFTLQTPDASPNRHVFYLQPGSEAQVRALAQHARGLLRNDWRPMVVAPADASFDPAVTTQGALGQAPVLRYERRTFDPSDLARKLDRADPILFLGSGAEAVALARTLEGVLPSKDRLPHLLLTGSAADASLFTVPKAFQGRIFLALPDLPTDPAPETAARYRDLAAKHTLPPEHRSLQLTALAAAEALNEALRRAGRDLTRERLIEQLETLRGFRTGFSQPVTYGPGRRLGIRGAWVVALDLEGRKLAPTGGWVSVDP